MCPWPFVEGKPALRKLHEAVNLTRKIGKGKSSKHFKAVVIFELGFERKQGILRRERPEELLLERGGSASWETWTLVLDREHHRARAQGWTVTEALCLNQVNAHNNRPR